MKTLLPRIPDRTPVQKQLSLLRAIAKQSSYPGSVVNLLGADYSLAWAENSKELQFHFKSLIDRGFILDCRDLSQNTSGTITTNGWVYLEKMAAVQISPDRGFVAMSFSDELKPIYEKAIRPGIENSGYRALRVDDQYHHETIDNKIIADIRESAFVVADMTEHKHGVYFEAGFALGLDRPVFWSVRKDHLDDAHFDTRQYPHIVWETNEELRDGLTNAILATMGRGPHRVENN